jgi:uncharacterized protein (DUF4415 family)
MKKRDFAKLRESVKQGGKIRRGELKASREYDFSKAKRGVLDPLPKGRTRITFQIDDDVLAWFKLTVDTQGGGNYRDLMNKALREYILYRNNLDAVKPARMKKSRLARECAKAKPDDEKSIVEEGMSWGLGEWPEY